jgi:hypothetical protein
MKSLNVDWRLVFTNTISLLISGGFRGGVRGVLPPKIRKAYVITLIKQFNK